MTKIRTNAALHALRTAAATFTSVPQRRLSKANVLYESGRDKARRAQEPHAVLISVPTITDVTSSSNNNSKKRKENSLHYSSHTLFDAAKTESMLYEELLQEHVHHLAYSGTCMAVMLTGVHAV
uniref:Uncharacterized protein n=2 Tax=Lygus hesperus TaxID=30085 RepID=A0A146MCE5_LYGHE